MFKIIHKPNGKFYVECPDGERFHHGDYNSPYFSFGTLRIMLPSLPTSKVSNPLVYIVLTLATLWKLMKLLVSNLPSPTTTNQLA